MKRARLPQKTEQDVLIASLRRCCLCVYLIQNHSPRRGQIAHLNGNPNDHRFDNLVWLCLEHHDEYDSRTSQSKGFTLQEVREYRDNLYRRNERMESAEEGQSELAEIRPLPELTVYERLRKEYSKELGFIDRPWRYHLWQVANQPDLFAYKAQNRADGICLLERIDLPDGRIVMACIQIVGNPGNSITNCSEYICFQACERFEIPPDRLVWLEHYDKYEWDDWNIVTYEEMPPEKPFAKPRWTPMTPDMWRDLRLKPKKRLTMSYGHYNSKLTKLFYWPKGNLQ